MPHLACLLVAASALMMQADPDSASEPRPAATAPSALEILSALETAMADAIETAEPSVVAIARIRSEDGETTLAVRGREDGRAPRRDMVIPPGVVVVPGDQINQPFQVQQGFRLSADFFSNDYGSGVVVGDAGQILTAFHVVKGAARLVVRAAGQVEFEAEVIAADPRSDLAVIAPKLAPGQPKPPLTPIALGDAGTLRKGSFLIALGNPFNAARDGRASASWGILSNIARRLELGPEDERPQLRHYPTLLQLDAKLNLGMSGGAVIDMNGALVGLTTAASNPAGFDAMAGYAIPIDALARRAIETLKQGREVEYGFLGVAPLGESNMIGSVEDGTPASVAGLRVNDQIIAVDDVPVSDFSSLVLALNAVTVGTPVSLRIQRQGREREIPVVLAKFPVDGPIIATNRPRPWRGLRVDHLSTRLRTRMIPQDHSTRDAIVRGGVVVSEVEPGSPADEAGLREHQIITAVNGQRVRTPAEFAEAVADAQGPVTLMTEGDRRVTVE